MDNCAGLRRHTAKEEGSSLLSPPALAGKQQQSQLGKDLMAVSAFPALIPHIARHTTLHFRGDMGLALNTRATPPCQLLRLLRTTTSSRQRADRPTFLEDRRLVDLRHAASILMLLIHYARYVALAASLSQCCKLSHFPPLNVAFLRMREERVPGGGINRKGGPASRAGERERSPGGIVCRRGELATLWMPFGGRRRDSVWAVWRVCRGPS